MYASANRVAKRMITARAKPDAPKRKSRRRWCVLLALTLAARDPGAKEAFSTSDAPLASSCGGFKAVREAYGGRQQQANGSGVLLKTHFWKMGEGREQG